MGHQVLPVLQVGVGWRCGDQFAVRATAHAFAVQIGDVAAQQAGCGTGRLILPVPVADIEGHADWRLLLFNLIEKTLHGLNAPTVGGLVVFYQQAYRLLVEQGSEVLQVTVFGEIAQ